jgi:hypothetical protein
VSWGKGRGTERVEAEEDEVELYERKRGGKSGRKRFVLKGRRTRKL